MKPKLSLTIADLPLGIGWKELFSLAKQVGFDGAEIVLGYKTMLRFEDIISLSKKYELPILTIHEPGWTSLGFFNYEGSFSLAKKLSAKYNAHPNVTAPITSYKTRKYFMWLKKLSERYNVEVLLENLPITSSVKIVDTIFPPHESTVKLEEIRKACEEFGFAWTLDTSHLNTPIPQEADGFKELFPILKNIHLSDFNEKIQHMSLGTGILNIESFLGFLNKNKYEGTITLELAPKMFYPKQKYFDEIKESAETVKKYLK